MARKRIAVCLKIASEKDSCENWRVPILAYYNIDIEIKEMRKRKLRLCRALDPI